jgi:hypothetical protein
MGTERQRTHIEAELPLYDTAERCEWPAGWTRLATYDGLPVVDPVAVTLDVLPPTPLGPKPGAESSSSSGR